MILRLRLTQAGTGSLRLVVREILPYPSTLVGSSPLPSSYLVLTTFKRNHDKLSYYLKFSAIPLREHVKFLSRHTRWVAGSTTLSAYRFLQPLGLPGRLPHGKRYVLEGGQVYVWLFSRLGLRVAMPLRSTENLVSVAFLDSPCT